MASKTCTRCKKKKPLKDFSRNKAAKDGLCAACKTCLAKAQIKYRQSGQASIARKKWNATEKGKETNWKNHLKWSFGAEAIEVWNAFFEEQNGVCPGCEKHQSQLKDHLALDHDHETGEYRGLLCSRCNPIAGSSEKHIQVLENIIKYLKDFYGSR